MSGISKLTEFALGNGWTKLDPPSGGSVSFFKWAPNMTRIEIHVVYDMAGRIEAVSLWHNQRRHIYGGTGVRAEAERLLRE